MIAVYIPVIVISTVSLCADYQNSMCKILLCSQASIDTLSQLVTLLVNISMIHTEYSYFNAIFISGTEIVVWYAEQILPKTSIYFVVFWSLFSTKGRKVVFCCILKKNKIQITLINQKLSSHQSIYWCIEVWGAAESHSHCFHKYPQHFLCLYTIIHTIY